ncbi:hypothetical protein, partial [Anaplasma phagocytophilum]|uniref:hypothetical protein n=1 Tax=Anaplasma phagocytophilum TaxID=948 RepID=UPI000AAC781C
REMNPGYDAIHVLHLLQHHDLPEQHLNAQVMNHAAAIRIITFNLRIRVFPNLPSSLESS